MGRREKRTIEATGPWTTLLLICCLLHSLRMYNSLVEKCFKDCVESFRRKDLESTEEKVRPIDQYLRSPITRPPTYTPKSFLADTGKHGHPAEPP